MPTAAERQALAFLAGVALLGGGVRAWQQHHTAASAATAYPPGAESVEGQLSAIDGARKAKRSRKSAATRSDSNKGSSRKPSARAGRARAPVEEPLAIVDVDIASATELEKLPRIGAALAGRIVANRDSFGAFGSLKALGTVRGIGDAMLASLSPLVTFSGRPRATDSATQTRSSHPRTRRKKSR